MSIDRRDFLRVATAGAGLAMTGASASAATGLDRARSAPAVVGSRQTPDVIVVGAGNFGIWTALHLQRRGARVTVVDQYGPGNSRAASGGETRGVRTSYGNEPHGLLWGRWAARAIGRWKAWDAEHRDDALEPLFYTTGDLIMREEMEPFLEQTVANWDVMGHPYEVLTAEEIRYRWPVIRTPDVTVGLYEPDAGVVRARRAIESVAHVFQQEGGRIVIGKAAVATVDGHTIADLTVEGGDRLSGGTFVFALGPWFPKFFPGLMGKRLNMRTLGHVLYISTPPGDERFRVPNLPSYNLPGCTGWPALPRDSRGFRIRASSGQGDDPDTSIRTVPVESEERPREILSKYFPELAERAVNETRACHYASSVSGNFIIDRHPEFDNGWLAGGGSAESFKSGPVIGEYVAGRVLGTEADPELIEGFRLRDEEFEESEGDEPGRRDGSA